jgi:hypothetical protein
MKIYIKSNFVVPGLGHEESLDLDCTEITLREFLDKLSTKAPTRIEYVRPGAKTLNEDWEVDIDGIPYHHCRGGLETLLKHGNTVTIRIIPLGGG